MMAYEVAWLWVGGWRLEAGVGWKTGRFTHSAAL